MAPAIAHFLVGAGCALLLAAPIILRYDIERDLGLWLVALGGLWGLLPDIHHIVPVYREQLYAIHNSPWIDLFALHYLLDRPTIRALYLESVFGSILFFLTALAVFSGAQSFRGRTIRMQTPVERGVVLAVLTIVATGYAGTVVSVLVLNTGRYDVLAAVVGREGIFAGWLVLAIGSLAFGLLLAGGLEGFAPKKYRQRPTDGLIAAGLVAIIGWLVASVVVPLWLRYQFDAAVGVPYIDLVSLLGVLSFTSVFMLVYTLIRGSSVVT